MNEWVVPVVVVRVTDGDSIWVDADLGWHLTMRMPVRVAHINAPETSTPEGRLARDYARSILLAGDHATLTSHSLDKYGRTLGSIRCLFGDFASAMLAAGHAVIYEGGPR